MSRFASRLRSCLLVIALTFLTLPLSAQATEQPSEARQSAVLVRGASSGIGRTIAERLASEGHFVYAGARKPEDIEALSRIPNMQGIRLDVTSTEEIEVAVETIRSAGRGLHGLVNNAGVVMLAPLIEMEEEDFNRMFDVNVAGPYRITKAFAPLLIESKGRITTISSLSGIGSWPLMGAYSMSKHAVEAFADTLAQEMERYGVKVSVIEPGNFRTNIGRNSLPQVEAAAARYPDSLFHEQMRAAAGMWAAGADADAPRDDPKIVADAVLHALFDDAPKHRYMAVTEAWEAQITIGAAMEELVQLNQWQPFRYDRDALVKMLDAMLEKHE